MEPGGLSEGWVCFLVIILELCSYAAGWIIKYRSIYTLLAMPPPFHLYIQNLNLISPIHQKCNLCPKHLGWFSFEEKDNTRTPISNAICISLNVRHGVAVKSERTQRTVNQLIKPGEVFKSCQFIYRSCRSECSECTFGQWLVFFPPVDNGIFMWAQRSH